MCWINNVKLGVIRVWWGEKGGWFHSAAGREVCQPKSLHELINIDAAVLVEVDAGRQVCYGLVTDVYLEVGAEELPGLTELLVGDGTSMEKKREMLVI